MLRVRFGMFGQQRTLTGYVAQSDVRLGLLHLPQPAEYRHGSIGCSADRAIGLGIKALFNPIDRGLRGISQLLNSSLIIMTGGEGEIRTHEGREALPVFKTGAFNRSATSPSYINKLHE